MMANRLRARRAPAPPNGGRLLKISVSFLAALLCVCSAAPARVFAQAGGKRAKASARADKPRLRGSVAYPLVISEFRLRGPGPDGHNNEYVEIFNTSDLPHTVVSSDGSAGYAVAASDGIARFVIPNNTIIPGRGHFLGVNAQRYSLSDYGGTGAAAGDTVPSPWTLDTPDTAGVALFDNATPANFTAAHVIDAVGPATLPADSIYREGTGLAALPTTGLEYAVVRDLSAGLPRDTDNNAADFIVVDANAPASGSGLRLGAPGPENLSSPRIRNSTVKASLIDPLCSSMGTAAANLVPGLSPDGAPIAGCQNSARAPVPGSPSRSAQGDFFIRRRFTNMTGQGVTRLRFRVVDITTFNSPSYAPGNSQADLRALSSGEITITTTGGQAVEVKGLALEMPPGQDAHGGGWNSTLSLTLGSQLANGDSVVVQFRLGVQQPGAYRFFVNVEALP